MATEIVSLERDLLSGCLERASRVLDLGGIVAYPTETFYALGALHSDANAISRIFDLKGRDWTKGLPLIIPDMLSLEAVAKDVSDIARALAGHFWPGPLTLVLPARDGLDNKIAQQGTVAVRVPGESVSLHLVRHVKRPITATSANPAGLTPATTAQQVMEYFPTGIDLVIDGGQTPGGLPSTIVELHASGITIHRAGAISERSIKEALRGGF